jgi:hypothetical protein
VIKIAGAVVLMAVLGVAVHGAVAAAGTPATPATSYASSGTRPPARHSAAGRQLYTLRIMVIGERCQIFVRVPGGAVLTNGTYQRGESVRYTEPQLDVVLSDSGAVRVYANGRVEPPGTPGQSTSFSITLGSAPSPMVT